MNEMALTGIRGDSCTPILFPGTFLDVRSLGEGWSAACIVYQMDNGRMLFRMLDHLLLHFLKNIIYGEHIISIILVFLCGIVFSRSEHYNFGFVYNTRIVPQGICLPKHAKKIGAEARASGWNRTVSLSQLCSLLLCLSFP